MPRRRRQIRTRTHARKRMLCITLALLPLAAAIAALVTLLVTRKKSASAEGIDDAAVLEAQLPSLPSALNESETEPPISLVSKTIDPPSPPPSVSDASPPPSIPATASQFSFPSSNDIVAIASSSSYNLSTSVSTSNALSNSVPPSSVPSTSPTAPPSLRPTGRPSVAPTSESPTNLPTSYKGDFPYAFPAFRYKEWSKLDKATQEIAANILGYTPTSWNVVGGGFAAIERKGWAGLDFDERVGTIRLGYDKNTWECFVHHYRSYTWERLGAANAAAQEGARALGWTRALWDGGGAPDSDDEWWGALTETEALAANGLCYFEDNWNQVDMNPNRSFFPHPPPEFRYVPWRELSATARGAARDGMDYGRDAWNVLDANPIEAFRTFYDLDASQREAASNLGFYPHSWNCFINHFRAISWRGFYGDTKLAVEALGWTVESWDRSAPAPASEGKDWDELSPRERAAATLMCYFRETWDNVAITEWYDYEKGTNTAIFADRLMLGDVDMSIFRSGNLM